MVYRESNCTITLNGHDFTANGAFVSDDYLVAYPAEHGVLNDWHGKQLGTYEVVSSRPAVFFGCKSWMGSRYYYMHAKVNGKAYSLRGFGVGMIARGRAVKGK